jgi:DnaJ-class molecular chaperone
MAVTRLIKCPTCIGIGYCGEGDKCTTCEGTGEVPNNEVIVDNPCQPIVVSQKASQAV